MLGSQDRCRKSACAGAELALPLNFSQAPRRSTKVAVALWITMILSTRLSAACRSLWPAAAACFAQRGQATLAAARTVSDEQDSEIMAPYAPPTCHKGDTRGPACTPDQLRNLTLLCVLVAVPAVSAAVAMPTILIPQQQPASWLSYVRGRMDRPLLNITIGVCTSPCTLSRPAACHLRVLPAALCL